MRDRCSCLTSSGVEVAFAVVATRKSSSTAERGNVVIITAKIYSSRYFVSRDTLK